MDIQITETIVHENYLSESISHANDIAIIRLAHSAPFTNFIQPICLPVAKNLQNKNYDNIPLMAAGFGRTESGNFLFV